MSRRSIPQTRVILAAVLLLTVWACESTSPGPISTRSLLSSSSRPASLDTPIRTIVIDAGHGAHDPGTSHFGLQEKHLALDIARRLRGYLQQQGLSVVMTRDSDTFLPLSRRPGMANRLGADLFISVHINANRSRRVSGAEVYYPRESVVAESASWPPFVRASEIGIPSLTIKQILWDMVLGRTRSDAYRLGADVCHAMERSMSVRCAVKPARFVVLREAWMPAVLVEVGYVSNQAESRRLATSSYRDTAARAIATGVIGYIRSRGAQHI